MTFDALRTGAVIRFPYLWAREAAKGETEGRKFRPVAVGVRIPDAGGADLLILFPITTQTPAPERFAAEILDTEKRRAGLDGRLRLWIVLDEYDQDVIGRSFYLEPEPPLGYFSRALPLLQAAGDPRCTRFIAGAKPWGAQRTGDRYPVAEFGCRRRNISGW